MKTGTKSSTNPKSTAADSKTAETPVTATAVTEVEGSETAAVATDDQRRTKNRRVVVAMWPQKLSDGVTCRVQQVLDFVLIFKDHPEFVKSLNAFRKEVYGDLASLYDTRRIDIPNDPQTVVNVAIINSRTGAIVQRKVFSGTEAVEYMAKVRQEKQNHQANRSASQQPRAVHTDGDFGTSISDAIASARAAQGSDSGTKSAASN